MKFGLYLAFDWALSALRSLADGLDTQGYPDAADEIREIEGSVRKVKRKLT